MVPDVPESLELKVKRERYLAKQALAENQEALLVSDRKTHKHHLHRPQTECVIINVLETHCLLAFFSLSLKHLIRCFVLSFLQQHGNCIMKALSPALCIKKYILILFTLDIRIIKHTIMFS